MSERGLDRLALALVLLWGIGAAMTHVVGIWFGVGGTALGLGLAAFLFARATLIPRLRPSGRLIAWGLAAAAGMIVVTYGLYPLALRGPAFLTAGVPSLYVIFRAAEPFWVTRAVLPFIILSEELVWRGVVLEAMLRRWPSSRITPAAVVLLSGVVYAAAHAPAGSPTLTVVALACGVYWSALRVLTGSLVPPLVSHLVWDLMVLALRPLS